MNPTLLIMAAGMGSRFGGLKQIEGVGPSGETIMEYSVFDAIRCGFKEAGFIIRKDFEEDFRKRIVDKIQNRIPVKLIFQEIDDLPPGFSIPKGREKPWGTAHAVWTARHAVQSPFLVLNADDFYGKLAFRTGMDLLEYSKNNDVNIFGLIGYPVGNTLSDHGSVTRARCITDGKNKLTFIEEIFDIHKRDGKILCANEKGQESELRPGTIVSMNMWCFNPMVFNILETKFINFLANTPGNKNEFLIPTVVNEMVKNHEASVQVINTSASWAGMTYKEDAEDVRKKIKTLVAQGIYPENLWK